ncbi:hypothetical protein CANINC_003471 [Pichia inconspicua]|uniref:Gluconokinase n=1 Tax=Pichia inconspicua TaxID=52247 RepID=A0A4T0WYR0_9ASCO|nr:hypothetical protein CANINC_003471 [[Candida] inconspicua]
MRVIVIGGVSGCGKSTVGRRLAEKLQCPFIEGDDHHSDENVRKMHAGIPLTDEDRLPWLQQLCKAVKSCNSLDVVVSCSMLKRSYRDAIVSMLAECVCILIILARPASVVENALQERQGHFINQEDVHGWLQSQMRDLEIQEDVNLVEAKGVDETLAEIEQILKK